jgi:hypothetical protein
MTTRPRPNESIVHLCDWSGQPDIHLLCNDTWTQPAWTLPACGEDYDDSKPPKRVYPAESGAWYTFDEDCVTCPACLASRSALQP